MLSKLNWLFSVSELVSDCRPVLSAKGQLYLKSDGEGKEQDRILNPYSIQITIPQSFFKNHHSIMLCNPLSHINTDPWMFIDYPGCYICFVCLFIYLSTYITALHTYKIYHPYVHLFANIHRHVNSYIFIRTWCLPKAFWWHCT